MNEERIQELKRHRDFARSLYKIAGDWGDLQYMKLNSLVEFLEDELTEFVRFSLVETSRTEGSRKFYQIKNE